ncbi:hypothetical protein OHB49_21630 [Streptomyces sp. NBC_01717]|nr:hypothetical protein [Streptomyces sp. NBC_01717]
MPFQAVLADAEDRGEDEVPDGCQEQRQLKGAPLAREISVAVLRTTAARSIRELVEALTEQARLIQRRWSDADAGLA